MKKIALLYPGQGTQYVGMGQRLYNEFSCAKSIFDEANDILGFDLRKLCFEGDLDRLTRTDNAQPALFTVSVAAFKAYIEETETEPWYAAGHSLGEFTALTCCGAVKFADALRIVRYRGELMQEAAQKGKGTMLAVSGVEVGQIEEICRKTSTDEEVVSIACYNSPNQIVISGHLEAADKAGEKLKGLGAQVVSLKVGAAFHSILMRASADKLREALTKKQYSRFKWPVISNITAQPYKDEKDIIENLTRQMYQPVRWQETMAYLESQMVDTAVELGPGTVLKKLCMSNAKKITAFSYDKAGERAELIKHLKANNKKNVPSLISKCLAAAVCTKNSNWDENQYQQGVIEPYRKIQQIQNSLEEHGIAPTLNQMQEALNMLKSLLTAKNICPEEQNEIVKQILKETDTEEILGKYV